MSRRPPTAAARSLASALFLISSLAVGLAAFVVLAVLARSGDPGELAAASAVMGVSFVLAVVPGAIQLRSAARAAAGEPAGLPLVATRAGTAGLLLAAVPLALLLGVPTGALVLLALQFAAACVASAQRGLAIGRADHRHATESMAVEAAVRVVAGVGLGLVFGAAGLAASLLLGSTAAALAGRRWSGPLAPVPTREVIAPALCVGLLMVLVNLDAFAAPRLLGGAAADAYALAELPARGLFFALFAVSWLSVPLAIRATTRRQLAVPVAGVLAVGAAAGLSLLLVRPLMPIALGAPAPPAALMASLLGAMTVAAALATALAMAAARGAARPWLPTLVAAAVLAAVILGRAGADTPQGLADAVLLCTTGALTATAALLGRTVSRLAAAPAVPPLLAGR